MKNFFLFILFCFTLTACSSPIKRANQLQEAGHYEEAIQVYNEILKKDKNNHHALSGLKKSQKDYIDQKLIQVRMSRLANQLDQSLVFLKDVIEKENEWKLSLSTKLAFTQEEEIHFSLAYAKEFIQKTLTEHHPLQAEIFLENYASLFKSYSKNSLTNLKKAIQADGKRLCMDLRKSRTEELHYYNQMVSQLCLKYGEHENNTLLMKKSLKQFLSESIGSVSFTFPESEQNNLGQVERIYLEDQFFKALKETAWFHTQAPQNLKVIAEGQFNKSSSKNETILVKEYIEKENYIEQVLVTKKRMIPTDLTTRMNPATGTPESSNALQYRTETYHVLEPQQKTRDIVKHLKYPAWKHEQILNLSATVKTTLLDRPFIFSLQETSKTEGIEHNENYPNIGLSPSKPNLVDPDQWQKEQLSQIVQKFKENTTQLWQEKYCKNFKENGSFSDSSQTILKCIAQPAPQEPLIVEQWSKNNFGISINELRKLNII